MWVLKVLLKLLIKRNDCWGPVKGAKGSPVGVLVYAPHLRAVLFVFFKHYQSKNILLVVIMHWRASTLVLLDYLYLNMHEAQVFAENHLFSHCFTTVESAVPSIGAIHQGADVKKKKEEEASRQDARAWEDYLWPARVLLAAGEVVRVGIFARALISSLRSSANFMLSTCVLFEYACAKFPFAHPTSTMHKQMSGGLGSTEKIQVTKLRIKYNPPKMDKFYK